MEHELQRLVDALFRDARRVSRLDVLTFADAFDVGAMQREIVESIPPGTYSRPALVDQLNSSITAHGWRLEVGLVE